MTTFITTRRPASARGFTLVELLVVILIIGILAGILTVAITGVLGGSQERITETRLEILNTAMTEYRNSRTAGGSDTALRLPVPDGVFNAQGRLVAPTGAQIEIPGDGDVSLLPPVRGTAVIMATLARVPSVAQALNDVPDEAKIRVTYNGQSSILLRDGFGNPILYVPAAGLTEMAGDGWVAANVLRASDGSAFFASAGRDGSFRTPGDNLYSRPVRLQQ